MKVMKRIESVPVWTKWIVMIAAFAFISWSLNQAESIDAYVVSIKDSPVTAQSGRDTLRNTIAKKAHEIYQPASDARVDRIWKAIPGYNGIQIDEETTYRLAEQMKEGQDIPYVYKEIPTKVNLDDLGAVPIYRGNPNKPIVSFMINVAWGTEYLDDMLKTLNEAHVKATFFLDGSWLSKNKAMAQRIVEEGHEIGNHGYSHAMMSRITVERMKQEMQKTEDLIQKYLGIHSSYFAPPAGDYNQQTVEIANKLKMKTVLWTLDTVDWQKPSSQVILNRIVPKVNNGMLILMHPTDSTKEALPTLIKEIKRKGLTIGTVSENFSPKRLPKVESGFSF